MAEQKKKQGWRRCTPGSTRCHPTYLSSANEAYSIRYCYAINLRSTSIIFSWWPELSRQRQRPPSTTVECSTRQLLSVMQKTKNTKNARLWFTGKLGINPGAFILMQDASLPRQETKPEAALLFLATVGVLYRISFFSCLTIHIFRNSETYLVRT